MSTNEDLSKNFNFLLKILQDFVTNTKNYSQVDYNKINAEFIKAANSTGLTPKDAMKLINSSITKIGMPGKNTDELKKVLEGIMNGGVDRLGKIMDPDIFLKTIDEFFIRVKTLPVNLNNKENISIISKAIAKGNRDYASTGLGKKTADFYKNATDKQIIALATIRKQIKDGVQLKNDNNTKGLLSSLIKGTVMGVGGVADVLMENAGFGELPGKFITMLNAGKDVFKGMKKDKLDAEEERNAFLLDSAKMSEASLQEISERNKKNQEIINKTTDSKNQLKGELSKALSDALNSTSFGKKKKNNILAELESGTIDENRIGEIIADLRKKLGPNISKENQQIILNFQKSMIGGITDLQDIVKLETSLIEKHNENLDKEAESIKTVLETNDLRDALLEKTILERKKERDKRLKKLMGKGFTKEVEELSDREDAIQVRKQFGIADSEESGAYSNKRQQLIDIHKNMNPKMEDEDISKLVDTKFSDVLAIAKKREESMAKVSDIFKSEDMSFKDAEKKIPNLRFKNVTATPIINTKKKKQPRIRNNSTNPNVIGPVPLNNVQNMQVPSQTQGNVQGNIPQTTNNQQATPKQNKNQNNQLPQNRPNGLVNLEKNSEFLRKQYDLMKKIYGEDGSKFAKTIANQIANTLLQVKVVNFPSGGSNAPKGKITTPPDAS